MYRYLHQRNQTNIKLKRTQQLLTHTETRNRKILGADASYLLQKFRIYSSKNYFRLWILAEVEPVLLVTIPLSRDTEIQF